MGASSSSPASTEDDPSINTQDSEECVEASSQREQEIICDEKSDWDGQTSEKTKGQNSSDQSSTKSSRNSSQSPSSSRNRTRTKTTKIQSDCESLPAPSSEINNVTQATMTTKLKGIRVVTEVASMYEIPEPFRTPAWISEVKAKRSPYFPQLGDDLVYFRQGHAQYVRHIEDNPDKFYTFDEEMKKELPYVQHPDLPAELSASVVDIKFELLPPRVVHLTLARTVWETGDFNGSFIFVKYHPVASLSDFLVLRQIYDKSLNHRWNAGDKFRCLMDKSWRLGTVQAKRSFNPEFPDSNFLSYDIEWDSDHDHENLSPWDIEIIPEDLDVQENHNNLQRIPASPEELRNTLYQVRREDWEPNGHQEAECQRISRLVEGVMNLAISEAFSTPVDLNMYPDYAFAVEYPIDLSTIKARLDNLFYRRVDAIVQDIEHIATNAEKYNQPETEIIKNAHTIRELLLEIVHNQQFRSVHEAYHRITGRSVSAPASESSHNATRKRARISCSSTDEGEEINSGHNLGKQSPKRKLVQYSDSGSENDDEDEGYHDNKSKGNKKIASHSVSQDHKVGGTDDEESGDNEENEMPPNGNMEDDADNDTPVKVLKEKGEEEEMDDDSSDDGSDYVTGNSAPNNFKHRSQNQIRKRANSISDDSFLDGNAEEIAAGKILRELERLNSSSSSSSSVVLSGDKLGADQQTSSETTTAAGEVNSSGTSGTRNENADSGRKVPFLSSTGMDIDDDDNGFVDNDQLHDDVFSLEESSDSSVVEENNVIFPSTSNSSQSGRNPVVEMSFLSDSDEDVEISSFDEDGEHVENVESQSESEDEEGSLMEDQTPSSCRRYSRRQRSVLSYYESGDDSDDDHFESSAARRWKSSQEEPQDFVEFTPRNFRSVLKPSKRDLDFVKYDCVNVSVGDDLDDDEDNVSLDDFSDCELEQWQKLFTICGPHIESIRFLTWSWTPLENGKCPYNLFKILVDHCPNLRELSLQRVPAAISEEVEWPNDTKLLNLKTLKITHDGEINYREQLQSILKAAINLKGFKYSFANFSDLKFVLDIFKSLGDARLKKLKTLSIRSFAKSGYLTREQLIAISQLKAVELEELELGNGLWEDIEGPVLEEVLNRFPKLKKVIIYGNFQGSSVRKPDIVVNIPPLKHLVYLDIGGNYEFESVFEDEQTDFHPGERIIAVDDDEVKTDLFSVSVNLPLLPNLETIVLGNLFRVDNLHFASLPKLTSFRVGSPWHISVTFPPEESRRNFYPKITELQLPDCLKDESFVRKIPLRFPNLKTCWIFLPTVCVLRSFFKAMEDSDLEGLYFKTQFDFPSTMETCLLEKPTTVKTSKKEKRLEEILLNYEKFQDFIEFHNIELPAKEREKLEGAEYAGIRALKFLKILRMEHIGRRLRIPEGNLPVTHYKCQFTNEFLGLKKYPLSKKCLSQLPRRLLTGFDFDFTYPHFWFNINAQDARDLGLQRDGYDDQEDEGESSSSKLKVRIQPAMLQADLKFHQKKENE